MRKYPGIPELLETYMEESAADERWVTVQELRDRFGMTRYESSTVSGFLRRLKFGSFGQCPYLCSGSNLLIGHSVQVPRNTGIW
jgi:hypothetical protein